MFLTMHYVPSAHILEFEIYLRTKDVQLFQVHNILKWNGQTIS